MLRGKLSGVKVVVEFLEIGRRNPEKERLEELVRREGGEIHCVVKPGVNYLVTDSLSHLSHEAQPTLMVRAAQSLGVPVILVDEFMHWVRDLPTTIHQAIPQAPTKPTSSTVAALSKDFPHPHSIKFQDVEGRHAPFTASFPLWPSWRVPNKLRCEETEEKGSSELMVMEHYDSDKSAYCFICNVHLQSVEMMNLHELETIHLNALKTQYAIFHAALPPIPFPPQLTESSSLYSSPNHLTSKEDKETPETWKNVDELPAGESLKRRIEEVKHRLEGHKKELVELKLNRRRELRKSLKLKKKELCFLRHAAKPRLPSPRIFGLRKAPLSPS